MDSPTDKIIVLLLCCGLAVLLWAGHRRRPQSPPRSAPAAMGAAPEPPQGVAFTVKEFDRDGWWGGHFTVEQLRRHPRYVPSESEAHLVFAALGREPRPCPGPYLARALQVPAGSMQKPWVVWANGLEDFDDCEAKGFCGSVAALMRRRDMLFVDHDLRNPWQQVDDGPVLPGATYPAGPDAAHLEAAETKRLPLHKRPKYLLSFKGHAGNVKGRTTCRPDLRESFSRDKLPRNVSIAIEFDISTKRYRELLTNSAFVLMPRGHGRWLTRIREVLGACAIPVFMANGKTLPFEQIIDWKNASLVLDEALAKDAQGLLAKIPTDHKTIVAMRTRVCEIYHEFFEDKEKMFNAMLRSLMVERSRLQR